MRKLYVSDTHFSHARILEMCRRPFGDIRQHDEALIQRWNAVAQADDIVFHLGDFSFGLGDEERVRSIFFRLNGRKRLILGNHDLRKDGSVHPNIAALPWDRPPTQMTETKDAEQRIILCHYALREWPGALKGSFHFYGHSHGNLPSVGRSRDIGVDMPDVDFTPRTFQELTRRMK